MTTPTTPEGRRELKALAERVQIGMAAYVRPDQFFKERGELLNDGAATVLSLLAALEEAEGREAGLREIVEELLSFPITNTNALLEVRAKARAALTKSETPSDV